MCGNTLLAELRPRAEGPVTLVFGSFAYHDTVLAWIDSVRRAACEHFRIVCMDEDLRRFLHRHGAGGHALDGIVPCGVELGEWQLPLVPYESSMLRHVSNQAVGRGQCVQGADQVT